ncbi:hypothetical protein M885DRAFT_612225 [Pelagophyceae sp. CCMP2097]|nr:hypothetical protein M885DRAFT_612225 [Pelagophyceae sp. CCMP2097]
MRRVRVRALRWALCVAALSAGCRGGDAPAATGDASTAAGGASTAATVARWCARNVASPEPSALIYNRLAKTGGTTMFLVIEKQMEAKRRAFSVLHLNSTLVRHAQRRDWMAGYAAHVRAHLDAKRAAPGVRAVVVGHFALDPSFPRDAFGAAHGWERMQLFRDCASRAQSNLVYNLYESGSARRARRKKTLGAYQARLLPHTENLTVAECLRNVACLERHRQRWLPLTRYQTSMLGGTHVFANLVEGYHAFGFIDQLEETFDVLRCAYPSVFKSARARAAKRANSCSGGHCRWDDGATALFREACADENRFLARARKLFEALHAAATEAPQACCRQPP